MIPESVYYEGVLKAKRSERVDRIKKCLEEGLIKVIKPAKDDIEFAQILRLAHKRSLIDKNELVQLVEMLHEILFFTDDLEKWILSQ